MLSSLVALLVLVGPDKLEGDDQTPKPLDLTRIDIRGAWLRNPEPLWLRGPSKVPLRLSPMPAKPVAGLALTPEPEEKGTGPLSESDVAEMLERGERWRMLEWEPGPLGARRWQTFQEWQDWTECNRAQQPEFGRLEPPAT